MAKGIGRREFIKKTAGIGFSTALGGSLIFPWMDSPVQAFGRQRIDIAVASGSDYLKNTTKAVGLLGGMKRFVKNVRVQ